MAMQQLKKIYRSNYAGENVVTQMNLQYGEWTPETEFVPNSVTNTFATSQAVAIGNGESRAHFDMRFIQYHQGGLLAKNKLQSYACNAAYRDFTPDFLIATGDDIVEEIAGSGYCANNIVYTNSKNLVKYPSNFYLIPQDLPYDAGAIAAYMACFDGHKKVFLMGYDQYDVLDAPINNVYKNTNGYPDDTGTTNGEFFARSLNDVMTTYSDVEFVRVMTTKDYVIHPLYAPLVNFRQIDYAAFVSEADIGGLTVAS
jgi:hypothetical protein